MNRERSAPPTWVFQETMTRESSLLASWPVSGVSNITGGPTPFRQEAWAFRSAAFDGLIHSMDEAAVPWCGDLGREPDSTRDAKEKMRNKMKTVADMLSIRFNGLAGY